MGRTVDLSQSGTTGIGWFAASQDPDALAEQSGSETARGVAG